LGNTLKELGRLKEAEVSYRQAIAENPNYAEIHYNLGNTLKELEQLKEAEVSYRQAIAVNPDYTEAYSNLGLTLQDLDRLEEAEVVYRKAIAVNPDYAQAYSNLGVTLKELGRLEEAEVSYREAIKIESNFIEAHNNLGVTLKDLGRSDEAEVIFRQTIEINPEFAEAYNNLGLTLQELGRLNEAEASYRKASELKPDYADAYYNLGLLLYETKQYEKAIEYFKLHPSEKSKSYLLRCLYLQDKESLFFDQLDYFINLGEINPMIGSLGCRSALKYGVEKPNLFCKDPLKYVLKTDLNSKYDFEKIFVKTTRTVLNDKMIPNRKQGLLTNGYQTFGNLFHLEPHFTEEIQKIIRLEIEKYKVNFKESGEGLITNWPEVYSIKGWLVSMKSGGELQPHMHEEGWISGSVYINVPSDLKDDSGNLVVCIEEKYLAGEKENQEKSIDVVTGSLCLFPSSLLHYTIPFESEEDRIVLAFDVVPKN
jgi:tetratricopeptide (TPR) repeat protein